MLFVFSINYFNILYTDKYYFKSYTVVWAFRGRKMMSFAQLWVKQYGDCLPVFVNKYCLGNIPFGGFWAIKKCSTRHVSTFKLSVCIYVYREKLWSFFLYILTVYIWIRPWKICLAKLLDVNVDCLTSVKFVCMFVQININTKVSRVIWSPIESLVTHKWDL